MGGLTELEMGRVPTQAKIGPKWVTSRRTADPSSLSSQPKDPPYENRVGWGTRRNTKL